MSGLLKARVECRRQSAIISAIPHPVGGLKLSTHMSMARRLPKSFHGEKRARNWPTGSAHYHPTFFTFTPPHAILGGVNGAQLRWESRLKSQRFSKFMPETSVIFWKVDLTPLGRSPISVLTLKSHLSA